jgi:FkbM family methyltransferase
MKTFLEIGSCDFDNLDHLLDEGWAGYFIEPIPVYFESLRGKIERPDRKTTFINCAISSEDGSMDMTYIDPSTANEQWVRGISHIKAGGSRLIPKNKELGYNIGKAIDVTVPCLTLDTFLKLFNITELDMLRIDTEGHELEILMNYSWTIKPKSIKIEHKFVDINILKGILTSQGYDIVTIGDDLYCRLNETKF